MPDGLKMKIRAHLIEHRLQKKVLYKSALNEELPGLQSSKKRKKLPCQEGGARAEGEKETSLQPPPAVVYRLSNTLLRGYTHKNFSIFQRAQKSLKRKVKYASLRKVLSRPHNAHTLTSPKKRYIWEICRPNEMIDSHQHALAPSASRVRALFSLCFFTAIRVDNAHSFLAPKSEKTDRNSLGTRKEKIRAKEKGKFSLERCVCVCCV